MNSYREYEFVDSKVKVIKYILSPNETQALVCYVNQSNVGECLIYSLGTKNWNLDTYSYLDGCSFEKSSLNIEYFNSTNEYILYCFQSNTRITLVKLNSGFAKKEEPRVFDLSEQTESCSDLYISSLVLNTYDYNNYNVFVNCDGVIKTIELLHEIITVPKTDELVYNNKSFEVIHNITNKTKEVIINELKMGFYQKDKIYKISGNNYTITISPTGINEHDKVGTYIDFSGCEKIMRNYYGLSSLDIMTELIIVPINTNEQNLINNIKYRLFSEYGELDLAVCLNEIIIIYYQSNTTIKNISSTISYSSLGINTTNTNNITNNNITNNNITNNNITNNNMTNNNITNNNMTNNNITNNTELGIIHKKTNKTKEEIENNYYDFYQDFEIGKIYEIFGNNFTVKISPMGRREYDKISTFIDFSQCENILRNCYNINLSTIITVLQIETTNISANNISYIVYGWNKERLDLAYCKDIEIKVYYQLNTSGNTSNSTNNSTIVTPKFTYYSVDIDNYTDGYYYFYINGNMINYSNNFKYNIGLIPTKAIGVFYNATCSGEVIQSSYYNFRFKCWFKPPQQYLDFIEIYEPANFKDFELLNWPNQPITKYKEIVSSDYIFYIKDYNYSETCDMYSDTFSFEIEMESSFKQGYLRSKTILLNISEPYKINPAICYLQNNNLNSTIKFQCNVYNLTQENRITNGIKIGGIYKRNITDEYLVTGDNIYIKLIDLDTIEFPFIECPKLFEINHCKNTNITAKKCEKCYLNYYKYLNNSECITCSQLNEGCDSCYSSGKCNKCIIGFDLKENNCLKKTECETDRYGRECKKCDELNQNCNECNKSGYCKRCKKGYYLTGIDSNSKCVKCISTCEECDSFNKCTKCSDGLILDNEANCVSCFSLNEGCEKCNKNGKCTKCYNNKNLLYEIKNDICVKKEEEKARRKGRKKRK